MDEVQAEDLPDVVRDTGKSYPSESIMMETTCMSQSSLDVETDSVPCSADVSLSKDMRDTLDITAETSESPKEDIEEEKKMCTSLENDPRQDSEVENVVENLPSLSSHNAAAEHQKQNQSSVLSERQDTRLEEARHRTTASRALRRSEDGAFSCADEGGALDYGDEDLAKVQMLGSDNQVGGLEEHRVGPQGEVIATTAAPDSQPATRPKKPILVAAVSAQKPCQTAAEGYTVLHTPTQEMSTSETQQPPAKSTDPEEDEHFDVLLLHSEHDTSHVDGFKKLANKHNWKVTTAEDFPPHLPKFTAFNSVFHRSTYTVLLLTDNFLSDFWCETRYQTALVQSIENMDKRYCVIPVICQLEFKMPMELSILTATRITSSSYEKVMRRSISVEKRQQRETAAGQSPTTRSPTTSPISVALGGTSKPPIDAAVSSMDEIYRHRRSELDPGSFASMVISPDDVFRQLCHCLDREFDNSHDWRMLAEKVGFKMLGIETLKKEKSPTALVLKCFCQKQVAKKRPKKDVLGHLVSILEEMQRKDAVNILSNANSTS